MQGKDRWTVLIYMVCDDPQGGELLDTEAIVEMDHITKAALSVADTDRVRVALQIDFRTLPGVWRRVIGKSTFVMPESNAATPATLYGFFDWAVAECPAEHYLLIFWGHSRGQFGLFGDPNPFDYTAQTLTLEELREALTAAKRALHKPVDVIAFKDCFMANLELAYELDGLADYLLASPGLVPVEGWPYDGIFDALTGIRATEATERFQIEIAEKALLAAEGVVKLTPAQQIAVSEPVRPKPAPPTPVEAAKSVLQVLEVYYEKEKTKPKMAKHPEVAYSLLSTAGAVPAVKALKDLLGEERSSVDAADVWLRPLLESATHGPGDRALVDLGRLAALNGKPTSRSTAEKATLTTTQKQSLNAFIGTLGDAQPRSGRKQVAPFQQASAEAENKREGLVIDHTGNEIGGIGVFVYPSSPKNQRDSLLAPLADERAYRRLAISTDTKWADIAFEKMPIPQFRTTQDISKLIAQVEQLERMGIGIDPRAAAQVSAYLRRRASASRNGNLTEADFAESAQFAAISEVAARLADYAAVKGGADFVKGGADFVKGGADFVKGGADFVKGGADFVGR